MKTVTIACMETPQGAQQVARILRSNGMHVDVWDPPVATEGLFASVVNQASSHHVIIDGADEARAREALRGLFASEWFLRAPDGKAYHSFEAATVDLLRTHVQNADTNSPATREVSHLADLLERHKHQTVNQAFHPHQHVFHHTPAEPFEGRTLAEWARACGCAHIHTRKLA